MTMWAIYLHIFHTSATPEGLGGGLVYRILAPCAQILKADCAESNIPQKTHKGNIFGALTMCLFGTVGP